MFIPTREAAVSVWVCVFHQKDCAGKLWTSRHADTFRYFSLYFLRIMTFSCFQPQVPLPQLRKLTIIG